MKLKVCLIFVYMCYTMNCFSQSNPIIIDFAKSKESVSMSLLFDKVEYVPLETTKKCLLKPISEYYLTSKYVIGLDVFYNTYLFDRKTGKFIREIGREGGGPEEYSRYMVYHNGLDEERNIIYADDHNKWKGYNLETGKMVDIIKKPLWKGELLSVFAPWRIGSDKYMACTSNRTGTEKTELLVFDKKGSVSKNYSYMLFYDNIKTDEVLSGHDYFYKYQGKDYFYEAGFTDTVYEITGKELLPHIIFHTGNKSDAYKRHEDLQYVSNQKFLLWTEETSRFIFFQYGIGYSMSTIYNGVYDKKDKQLYISQKKNVCESHYGFVNDMDGLTSFVIKGISAKGELFAALDSEILSDFIEVYGTSKMTEKGKKLVANLKEDDNPIIVIATLKK